MKTPNVYIYFIKTLFLVVCFTIYSSCKTTSKTKNEIKNNSLILMENKEISKKIYSPDKSKVLVLTQTTNRKTFVSNFQYQVIDNKTKSILKKGSFIGNKIEWLNNNEIKCYHHVGMVKKQAPEINLEKQKTPKNYTIVKI